MVVRTYIKKHVIRTASALTSGGMRINDSKIEGILRILEKIPDIGRVIEELNQEVERNSTKK
mgnify:CR=1 FL=1